jgi:hypothetical protein
LGDKAKFTMIIGGTAVSQYLKTLDLSVGYRACGLAATAKEHLPPRPLLHLFGAPQQNLWLLLEVLCPFHQTGDEMSEVSGVACQSRAASF